ncbi:MAG: CHAT domain-containing protein [Acidobacteriaceae bacterium]|nr:CHAT domain-containing protein [Acidobacteriaceae bacterium]
MSLLCFLHGSSPLADSAQRESTNRAFDSLVSEGLGERSHARYADAVRTFERAAEVARATGDSRQQARALLLASGSYIRLFRYRQALESADDARELAFEANDDTLAGASANNKATVYFQVGDYLLSAQEASESVALLKRSGRKDYLARALENYGESQAALGHPQQSAAAFQEAISVAESAGLTAEEAMAQDHLGKDLLDAGDLAGADRALSAARRLRLQMHDRDGLGLTTLNLAELAYKQEKYPEALKLLDEVFASGSSHFSTIPQCWPVYIKGEILVALGRTSEGLASFRRAVDLADSWRREALPGDATNTSTVVQLHSVYQDYTELAAELAIERHDPVLARQALEVLAENRASSLREQTLSTLGRELRLPPQYFELLSNLQTTQARVTLAQTPKEAQLNAAKLQQIRLELADLENQIGLRQKNALNSAENQFSRNSLKSIQLSLRKSELLLSFCLGKQRSFLWTVTDDQVHLYELPAGETIAAHAKAFSDAVRRASAGSPEGTVLSRELLGQLKGRIAEKPDWLIAADGALLDSVPFSSLPDISGQRQTALINHHTLRFVPSELLLTDAKPPEPQRGFVGIADPIYNLADSRRQHTFSLLPAWHDGSTASITLARLVGSEREVRSGAKSSGISNPQIFTGAQASGVNLRNALASRPEVIHFAVHVVSPEAEDRSGAHTQASEQAALALTMTPDNIPELLTKENIAALRVPGSLVVLSGCSSQQGENLPSAGLMGLSRAWLLAGASAVVVSAWPTPDDSGRFFSTFYSRFQAEAGAPGNLATRAAAALQQTQVQMQRAGNYTASPSFWAAYSLISKE